MAENSGVIRNVPASSHQCRRAVLQPVVLRLTVAIIVDLVLITAMAHLIQIALWALVYLHC
jgi:hypothetical protein